MWQNSKTQNVTKLQNSKYEEEKKLKIQIVTKGSSLNCDKTHKLELQEKKIKNSIGEEEKN